LIAFCLYTWPAVCIGKMQSTCTQTTKHKIITLHLPLFWILKLSLKEFQIQSNSTLLNYMPFFCLQLKSVNNKLNITYYFPILALAFSPTPSPAENLHLLYSSDLIVVS